MSAFKTHLKENPLYGAAIQQLMESNPKMQGLWVPSAYQIYYAFQSGILNMLKDNTSAQQTTLVLAKEINGYLEEYLRMNPQ